MMSSACNVKKKICLHMSSELRVSLSFFFSLYLKTYLQTVAAFAKLLLAEDLNDFQFKEI